MKLNFEDLTAITCPLSMLGEDTKNRLRNCGGPWEEWHPDGFWVETHRPIWHEAYVHRQAPRQLRQPSVQWDMMENWVQAVAMDLNGDVCMYDSRPFFTEEMWFFNGEKFAPLHTKHGLGCPYDPGEVDWTQSLVMRKREQ